MKGAAPILLGLAAAAALTAEAEGCSVEYQRPTDWPESTPIDTRLAQRNEPYYAVLVRNASNIEIAVVRDQTVVGSTEVAGSPYNSFSVQFEVIDRLKGNGSDLISVTRAGGDPIVERIFWYGRSDQVQEYRQDIETLEDRSLLEYEIATSCGDIAGVSFNTGWTYLVVRNGSGEIDAAIPLATQPLTQEEVQQVEFRDHLWIQTTLQALDNPLADRLYHATMQEFFEAHGGGELVEVTNCQRPVVRFVEHIGEPGLRNYGNNLDGEPVSLEEYLAEAEHGRVYIPPGDPPLGAADFAVIDERRYDLVPFDAETCRVGQRYIRFDFYQYFPIDENDLVDLTNVVSQVNLTGRGLYPLAEYRRWQEVEPVETVETESPQ